jgi:hypothetical protein
MKRTSFIQISLLGAGALMVPFTLESCLFAEPEPRLAIPDSLLSVCDSRDLKGIGKIYREAFPQEDDIEILASLIGAGLNPNADSFFNDLDIKITADYSDGQWVEVSGWLLSRTEARQCALYSLVNP